MENTNLWLFPTDAPSNLYKIEDVLLYEEFPNKSINAGNQNLYVTSNEETPKENDWFLQNGKPVRKSGSIKHYAISEPKIIFTTDQKLIKDGVQEVPAEFLLWFVRNPSCSNVVINRVVVADTNNYGSGEVFHSNKKLEYQITIPKEDKDSFAIGFSRFIKRNFVLHQGGKDYLVSMFGDYFEPNEASVRYTDEQLLELYKQHLTQKHDGK